MKAYASGPGWRIFHGGALEVLPELEGIGGLVTDPPYNSGGQFRGDRAGQGTRAKYANSESVAAKLLPEFTGDNRDQRGFLLWASLWLAAAHRRAVPGAVAVVCTDWRQLPTVADAVQVGGWVWRGLGTWQKTVARPRLGGLWAGSEHFVFATKGPLAEHGRGVPSVLTASPIAGAKRLHLAEKPEPVMRWALGVVPPGWPERALEALLAAGRRLGRFTVEDARELAGLEAPTDRRAWGAVVNRAARRGLIRRVGYAPARSSNAHADLPAVAGKVRRVVGNSGDVP